MLRIGTIKLNSKLILSPMAGISDLPFRLLNRKFGCELTFIEMINCRSISHKSRKTQQMMESKVKDRPLGVQILGCEEKYILKALDVLKKYKFNLLDFNAACPAKKVVRRGEGASLLKDPKKLSQLLKLVVENSAWPVTVKIRAGWDKDLRNAREVALLAQDSGVSGIFIHGRTKLQQYSGKVDYEVIRQVKEAVGIPVIASGDIFSALLAQKMFQETGCDAIAVARGSLGNPWIFAEISAYLEQGQLLPRPQIEEIIRVMREHLDSNIDFYGERIGVLKFRKFYSWYTKGMRGIRPLREQATWAKTRVQMEGLIKECADESRPFGKVNNEA